MATVQKPPMKSLLGYENQSFNNFGNGTDSALAILAMTSRLGFRLPRSMPPSNSDQSLPQMQGPLASAPFAVSERLAARGVVARRAAHALHARPLPCASRRVR